MDSSTFTLDPQTLEEIIKSLQEKGIAYEGCDWMIKQLDLRWDPEQARLVASNYFLGRENGKHFHGTLVNDSVMLPDGKVLNFRAPINIEHDSGHDKVGDVVIIFRRYPHTGRYMVQVEQENVFVDETTIVKIWRAERSSIDNIAQAVKKTVIHSGWIYSNARRQGGKQIKTHYVIANWAPQLADKMMDIYDYTESLDSPGLSSFTKALKHMPDRPAHAIFNQMRTPPVNGNGSK